MPPAPTGQLRPVRSTDAAAILSAFTSAPDMDRQGDVSALHEAHNYCAWLREPDRRATAIVNADDRMIGLVGVTVDLENLVGWFFYWLHAEARGHGLASRAAVAVANRALQPIADGGWGLARLELGHRANNPASGAVARAAGFVHEGTEREKFLIDGARHDVLTYGRLPTDPWPAAPGLPWAS